VYGAKQSACQSHCTSAITAVAPRWLVNGQLLPDAAAAATALTVALSCKEVNCV